MSQNKIKLSVCIVAESFHPNLDGGAVYSRLLAEQFYKNGDNVFVISRRNSPSYSRLQTVSGVSLIRIGPDDRMGMLGRYLAMFSVCVPLARHRHEYQVILVSNLRILGLPAIFMSKLLRKKCILRTDSCGEMDGAYAVMQMPSGSIKRWLVALYFKLRNVFLMKADAFVAISNDVVREFKNAGIPDKHISLIPNGVDTDMFSPVQPSGKLELRARFSIPLTAIVCAYSGRLTTEKGLESVIRVWKRLKAEFDDIFLIFIGSGKDMSLSCERQLREFAQINQLESSIYFTGAVNNVADYLQCADIFMFPSRTEALGLALIEANSCGIPAIGTRVGGIPDVIKDGVSGTLVEPDNDDQLYDATVELITNQEKREKMGLSARQIVLEKFTLFGVRQSYESLFENVLSSKG